MAGTRSPFFDSALHVLKGAVVSALRLPTGRTTASVKPGKGHAGRIVLNSVDSFSEEQCSLIRSLVDQKVREDAPFRVWRMLRADAERLYGDTMYDAFKVPDAVTELRLVNLERWNLNAQVNQVVKSTGYLRRLEITKTKHNANKKELEISFECFPDPGEPPLAETMGTPDPCPPLAEAVPDPSAPAPSAPQGPAAQAAPAAAAPQAGGAPAAPDAGDGQAKEKKPRPAPPPPPPSLATASLLVRAAAARVLGLRPGTSGGEMQPLWVTEPGNAKVSLGLEGCSRAPFPKDEAHGALLEAVEAAANELVRADLPVSLFAVDRQAAEADYGDAMYDPGSARGEVLHLAYVPGAILAEVPSNWSLCSTTAAGGRVSFQTAVEPGSKKKPDTMILAKKRRMMVRYSVEHPEAAGVGHGGARPSAAAVREFDHAEVRVSVPGVDSPALDAPRGPSSLSSAPPRAADPRFPYPAEGASASEPGVVYWSWFGRALRTRLRDVAAAAGRSEAELLRDPSAAGLRRLCVGAGHPLSEAELAHLAAAPLGTAWLRAVLAGEDLPRGAAGAREVEQEMVVTAMEVSGKIDYQKLVKDFGSTLITEDLLARVERLTVGRGRVPALHPWLRRSIFYSHRDLDRICTCVEQGKPFYLYTGRGPSSLAMHLGHLIPFMMTKWLQDAFDVPLVIQMTEDEKFLWKGKWDPEKGDDLMKFRHFTHENVKDIIAVGFDKKKTFIFSDLDYVGHMYPNIVRIWKGITYNTARSSFGFQGDSNIGQSAFCAIQAAPSFPTSFKVPLGGQDDMCCLIPCAIDQDPYFRLTREVAHKLVPEGHPLQGKPALLHAKFFPPLQGALGKMSASDTSSAIFLTDSAEEIGAKIHKYAFSGGRATAKEQRERGADLEQDVSYQWLRFFLEDDAELAKIASEYGSGRGDFWNTGSVKERLVRELQRIVKEHQARREKITDEEVAEWMRVRKLEF